MGGRSPALSTPIRETSRPRAQCSIRSPRAGLETLPYDDRRPVILACLAESCAGLRDSSRARVLSELLEPYEGLNLASPVFCAGPADRYLGLLSGARDDWAGAQGKFESAIEPAKDQPVWQGRARFDLATALVRQHRSDHAAALIDETLAAATAGGFVRLREDCLTLLSKEPHEGPTADGLSAAELRVLRLLGSGATNRKIGEQLHISPNTVANHVRNILAKTGTANRTEAANYARQNGLV